MGFEDFNLSQLLNKAIKENNFFEPTLIQKKSIPLILNSKDIIAKAQTGTGKTAAFVLPILNYFLKNSFNGKSKVRVLVLTPTRELAIQVALVFKTFSSSFEKGLNITTLIGGKDISSQLLDIQKGSDIVVATPGRLLDIYNKKQLDLTKLDFFVIDEADKMLELGFKDELEDIISILPSKRQNLLFSATFEDKIRNLSLKISKNFEYIEIENQAQSVEKIVQRAILVNKESRSPLLRKIIKESNWKKVLVFMANNKAADNISFKFKKYGFKAQSFHGNLEQDERNLTLDEFKNGDIEILFSSDLSSRGLHIDDIECVVNYDLPRSTADYIHRIGRTARAGKEGVSISFVTEDNFEHFKLIEKRCNINLKKEEIEGFEFKGELIPKKGKAPVKGKRKSKKDKLRENSSK